tara:strand:- start:281 stop:427 length:147 start_codon:yes stop_codon:yes gene_type:complete
MNKQFRVSGSFDFDVEAETGQEAKEEAQDKLADLNNICYEVEEKNSDE